MRNSPLVSIIISNYNYGRFLKPCIESVLDQAYPHLEVIVVDDGSTDNSREIIASFGNRLVQVLKENGGQASALNVGFSISHGKIVIFLDSDDLLLPETAQQVAAVFQSKPDVGKVQYRLAAIDTTGKPTGEVIPSCNRPMPTGDLRQHIIKFHGYVWSPTSGNAFAAEVLRQILPIPEDLYRITPDGYLNDLSAVFGPIVSLDTVGGFSRLHGSNYYRSGRSLDFLAEVRGNLFRTADGCARQKALLKRLYCLDIPEVGLNDLMFLAQRMISFKLDPLNHPFNENLFSICIRGIKSAVISPEIHGYRRLIYALWFVSMLIPQKSIVQAIARNFVVRKKAG
jgi:glycosyltransferase involved in cell wall biosynthesis